MKPGTAIVRAGDKRQAIARRSYTLHDAWSDFVSTQVSEDTKRTFRNALNRYRAFLASARGVLEVTPADMLEVTPADIIDFRDGRLAAGLKPSSVKLELSIVRRFYKFMREAGVIDHNPAALVKSPKVSDESSRGAISVEDAERLVRSVDASTLIGLRDRAMLALLVINGLRLVELSRARVGDIGRDPTGVRVLVVHGKGGKRADVKIRDDVGKVLDAWTKAAALEFGAGERDKPAPLFCALTSGKGERRRGGPMTTRAIRERVDAALGASGLKSEGVSAHWLRHTAVTHAIRGGADLIEAQTAARHSDPRTTQRYFHALARHDNSAVDCNPIRVA